MKTNKLLLLFLFVLASLTAQAQFQKGASLLEANVGVTIDFKNKDDGADAKTPYNTSLGLAYGRFITSKNEIGIKAGIGFSQYNYSNFFGIDPFGYPILNQATSKRATYSGQLYFRHYAGLTEKLHFSSGFSAGYFNEQVETRNTVVGGTTNTHSSNLAVGYTPSLVYMLSNTLGLRGSLGFIGFNFSNFATTDPWDTSFSLDLSPSNLNFGLFYLFNGAKSND